MHQEGPPGRDVPEPLQRCHPSRALQRHSHPLVAQSKRAPRKDAVSPRWSALCRRGQNRNVSQN